MRGYLGDAAATARTLAGGWLDTGDLGFASGGELFVHGRAKDLVIVRGSNHAPDEFEACLEGMAGLRPGCAVALGFLERLFHLGIFMPEYGGDPVLFQHFFWFYSHPAVYIMILPGMGVISEIIPCFARKRIFGYKFVAFSSVAIALIGFLVWGHHMFVSGQSILAGLIFSFLTFMVAIPSAVKVFNWIATLYKGSISFEAPMIYVFGFIGLFVGPIVLAVSYTLLGEWMREGDAT